MQQPVDVGSGSVHLAIEVAALDQAVDLREGEPEVGDQVVAILRDAAGHVVDGGRRMSREVDLLRLGEAVLFRGSEEGAEIVERAGRAERSQRRRGQQLAD